MKVRQAEQPVEAGSVHLARLEELIWSTFNPCNELLSKLELLVYRIFNTIQSIHGISGKLENIMEQQLGTDNHQVAIQPRPACIAGPGTGLSSNAGSSSHKNLASGDCLGTTVIDIHGKVIPPREVNQINKTVAPHPVMTKGNRNDVLSSLGRVSWPGS